MIYNVYSSNQNRGFLTRIPEYMYITYVYRMTIIHIKNAQVSDTHKEQLIHSLRPFYKCYNL